MNYWIFDETTDPVITLLPDGYFMHCALMILAIIFLSSLLSFILYQEKKRAPLKSRASKINIHAGSAAVL